MNSKSPPIPFLNNPIVSLCAIIAIYANESSVIIAAIPPRAISNLSPSIADNNINEPANIATAPAIFINVSTCKFFCQASNASLAELRVSLIFLPKPLKDLNTPLADSAIPPTSSNVPFKVFNTFRNVPVFMAFIIVLKSIEPKALPIPFITGFNISPIPLNPFPMKLNALSKSKLPI